MGLTAPIGLAMAATAPAIVAVMYGSQYTASAPPLVLLSIFTVLYSVGFHTGDVYKAIGRPGLLTAINATKLVLMVGPVWWAAGHSIVWVAAALLAVEVVHVIIRIAVVRRIIDVSLRSLMQATVPPIVAAGVAAVAIWQLTRLIDAWPAILQLLAAAPVFLAIYVCGLKIVSPQLVRDSLNLVRRDRGGVAMSAGGSQ
jgi:PST family polysaccharide transporter